MGGGASKDKNELSLPNGATIHTRERRMSHVDTNPPAQSDKLVECLHCKRSFASDRVDRHVEVKKTLRFFYGENSKNVKSEKIHLS
jgi:hypothetical protein